MNLREDIKAGIIALAKQHGVEKVILFGSRARGDHWERSDIDLAARGGDMVRFTLDVDDCIPTLLMFDVVNLDGPVQPELLDAIRRDGIVLYEKEQAEEDARKMAAERLIAAFGTIDFDPTYDYKAERRRSPRIPS